MTKGELAQMTDADLIEEVEKIKPSPWIDAFFIGFLIGIIIFSVASNALGIVTLIPLFFIYRLLKKSKKYDALQKEIKNRNLP